MKEISIKYTVQEANSLIKILDEAAVGIEKARICIYHVEKLRNEFSKKEEDKKETKDKK